MLFCYSQLQKIYLKEGAAFRYFKFEEIRKLKMVPWDLHAIYYFQLFYVNKQKNLLKLST